MLTPERPRGDRSRPAAGVEFRRLGPADADRLAALFDVIAADPSGARFHPHPFTRESAAEIAGYTGKDLYIGMLLEGALAGYGMLRGWDAGFEVPSLGIYLAPGARGAGLSKPFMEALHGFAREAGASRIRLKVYADNVVAMHLYRSIGYAFSSTEGEQLVGYIELPA